VAAAIEALAISDNYREFVSQEESISFGSIDIKVT